MIMQNERGQNTHSKGERKKIPFLPYNVNKKSVLDSEPTVESQHGLYTNTVTKMRGHNHATPTTNY